MCLAPSLHKKANFRKKINILKLFCTGSVLKTFPVQQKIERVLHSMTKKYLKKDKKKILVQNEMSSSEVL